MGQVKVSPCRKVTRLQAGLFPDAGHKCLSSAGLRVCPMGLQPLSLSRDLGDKMTTPWELGREVPNVAS